MNKSLLSHSLYENLRNTFTIHEINSEKVFFQTFNSQLYFRSKTLYTKEQEIAQAWYFNTKESSESRWADYEGISNRNEKKIQPLENFKLNLYGNGRVVAIERIDTKYRGKSALMLKYKNEEDQKRISFFSVFLHIPKGGNKLEVIR